MTEFFDVLGALAVVGLIGLLAWLALDMARERRRRRAYKALGTDHIDLYFDEHFPTIVRDFDVVTKRAFGAWAGQVEGRLGRIDHDLGLVAGFRSRFDGQVDDLEKRLDRLEKA